MRVHGGPDRYGAARHDFSVCANPLGPCGVAYGLVSVADPARYPDPASTRLREQLALRHAVAPERVLIAASASEFIQRMTAAAVRLATQAISVEVPRHGYGDYAAAASAWGLPVQARGGLETGELTMAPAAASPSAAAAAPPLAPGLRWWAEPSSPLGRDARPPQEPGAVPTVLDAVYEPLRLDGESSWTPAQRDAVYVLHSPNKALGLCGLRGAYAIAPAGNDEPGRRWRAALEALCPSWPLSAAGAAMLDAWSRPETVAWLQESLAPLRRWRDTLVQTLVRHRFEIAPSVTAFCCARPPAGIDATALALALRRDGIGVRNAASFGLPGWWRLSAQQPDAIAALDLALTKHCPSPGQPTR